MLSQCRWLLTTTGLLGQVVGTRQAAHSDAQEVLNIHDKQTKSQSSSIYARPYLLPLQVRQCLEQYTAAALPPIAVLWLRHQLPLPA